jgi:hypothetical protein
MWNKIKSNWKTAVGGFLGAAAIPLSQSDDPKLHIAGLALGVIAVSWFGYHAADAKKDTP